MKVLAGEKLNPPPIWMMRQAGRYLPEYQESRKRAGSFWTMCMTPDLASEVTLQPIRRYDFDAAIIFSDILVIPHALGQKVRFEDGVGPILEPLANVADLERDPAIWRTRLQPVYEALRMTRQALHQDKALIGFAGAPWTLAAYMVEGRGTKEQGDARLWAYENPVPFAALLEILSEAVAKHLIAQLEAGADLVQIFDSWAGGLPTRSFAEWVVRPTNRVVEKVRKKVPNARIIGFPREATYSGMELYGRETGVDALGIDTATNMSWAATTLGSRMAIQGNLDPLALVAGGDVLDRAVDEILEATQNVPFIFNLGHGIVPKTPTDNVARMIGRIRGR